MFNALPECWDAVSTRASIQTRRALTFPSFWPRNLDSSVSVTLPCFSSLSDVFLSCSILHSAIGTGFVCHLPTWQWLFPIVVITLWQSSFGTTALPFSILLYLLLLITFKCSVPSWCFYSVIIPRNSIALFLRLKELSFLWSEIILLSSGIFESLPAFSFVCQI